MNKKIIILLITIFLTGFNAVSVEAKEKPEESLNITTDFIRKSKVEVSEEGCLKLTKIDSAKGKLGLEKDAEVLMLIPEDEECVEEALEAIDDIKNKKYDSVDSRAFLRTVNADSAVMASSSSESATKSKTGWACKVSLTIHYREKIINGRDAVLLKKVSSKIRNGQSVYVSDYSINYGCSGTTPKRNYKPQSGHKSYGFVRASSSESKTIYCPSGWSYVYEEGRVATVGANITVNVKVRNRRGGVTKHPIRITNNLSF